MSETLNITLALKEKGYNYRIKDHYIGHNGVETFTFADVHKKVQISGKVIRSFNEGEIYHWPMLNHENIAPLIDVLYIRMDYNIFLTIDQEITLKDIMHCEDLVYDSRCFERKRSYARGIFSGLSYLHGKSLCLMNLSDANIVICKISDQAIITNFSCLELAKKTSKLKMKVPEIYRAPESEKGEFDPIAAEIWASGILILEMFLAHMVPWAAIDYKPKKIPEMVNNLSLELLQAANPYSVISFLDLEKFKMFLKCFFKQNPAARLSSRYALIASFLRPKFQRRTLQADLIDESMQLINKKQNQVENIKAPTDVIKSQRLLSKEICLSNQDKETNCIDVPAPLPFLYNSNNSLAVLETTGEKFSKSSQTVEAWTNTSDGCNYACYHTEALPFTKPKSSADNNISNMEVCSFCNVQSLPMEKSCPYNLNGGNSNNFFDDIYVVDELYKGTDKDVESQKDRESEAKKARNVIDTRKHNYNKRFPDLPKRTEASKLNLQTIMRKIVMLENWRISLQKQIKLFISEEFAYKQFKLLTECDQLLKQEHLQLCTDLEKRCKLDEPKKFSMCLDSRQQCINGKNKNLSSPPKRNKTCYKVSEHSLETGNIMDNRKDQYNLIENISNPNIRLAKKHSPCRAFENLESECESYEHVHEKSDREDHAFLEQVDSYCRAIENSGNVRGSYEQVHEKKDRGNYACLEQVNSCRRFFKNSGSMWGSCEEVHEKKDREDHVCLEQVDSYCRSLKNSGSVGGSYKQVHEKEDQEDHVCLEQKNAKENFMESIWELNNEISVKGNAVNKIKKWKTKAKRETESSVQENIRDLEKGNRSLSKIAKNKKDKKQKKVKKNENHKNRHKKKGNNNLGEEKRPFLFSLCPGAKVEDSESQLQTLCEACKLSYNK